jgi:hypothetical protein
MKYQAVMIKNDNTMASRVLFSMSLRLRNYKLSRVKSAGMERIAAEYPPCSLQ